jgi:putative ABC transport system permease protein
MDLPVLVFTIVVTFATGILFGVLPVFHSTRHSTHETLRESARGSSSRSSNRLRGALVVAELALSLMLLAGAGLLIRSSLRLSEIDPGFKAITVFH